MKISRKQNKGQPTAILAADIHLRPDTPQCRTDDFLKSQETKVDFIIKLAKDHQIPILIAGDLGHKSQWPNWLLEWTINRFRNIDICCIAGQHDLPNHKMELISQSGIGVLSAANAVNLLFDNYFYPDFVISPFNFGVEILKFKNKLPIKTICMTHQMIIKDKEEWPDQKATQAKNLLRQFPEYDLILSGDNHQPFVVEYEGRLLVNPGSIMRTTTIQIDHQPRVYLWYKDTNEVEAVYLPIEQDVISTDHVVINDKERSDRMDSYIQRIRNDIEIELSFEDNMISYIKKYGILNEIKEKILKCFPENFKLRV